MKKKSINAENLEVFLRHCEYCADELPKNSHLSRRYCPRKNGINDWCKYQHKRLIEQRRVAGETPIVGLKDVDVPKPPKLIESVTTSDELSEQIPTVVIIPISIKENNLNIISPLLDGKIEVEINIDLLLKAGYNFDVYDAKIPLRNTELFYNEIGDYALLWYTKDTILLTFITEVLCLV